LSVAHILEPQLEEQFLKSNFIMQSGRRWNSIASTTTNFKVHGGYIVRRMENGQTQFRLVTQKEEAQATE